MEGLEGSSAYDMTTFLWIVIAGSIASFIMSFGIGANDVANSFASSVGSRALKLWQAVLIASVTEFAGAVLMGASVAATIKGGLVNSEDFTEVPELFMFGMLCSLVGGGIWLLLATYLNLPVSTTHTIIGSILGFAIVKGGFGSVNWGTVGIIALSWIASPVLSAIFSLIIYLSVRYSILRSKNSVSRGLTFFPLLVAFTITINVFFIIYKGIPLKSVRATPLWQGILISIGSGLLVGLAIFVLVIPFIKRRLYPNGKDTEESQVGLEGKGEKKEEIDMESKDKLEVKLDSLDTKVEPLDYTKKEDEEAKKGFFQLRKDMLIGDQIHEDAKKVESVRIMHEKAEVFEPKTEQLFSYLQIATAIFDSYAHGSNDTANAVAPLAAIVAIYMTGDVDVKNFAPIWVYILGGGGIVCGLCLYGYKIIQSIGVSLVSITPSRGFAIELGSALVVVIASLLGIPVSTTHAQVGSTVAIGMVEGTSGFNWLYLIKIAAGWVITLVFSAVITGGLFAFGVYSPTLLQAVN